MNRNEVFAEEKKHTYEYEYNIRRENCQQLEIYPHTYTRARALKTSGKGY